MSITRCVSRAHLPVLVIVLFTVATMARAGQSFSLAWNANPDTTVIGYVVYYGTTTNYSTRLDVGTNTTATITNLQAGLTYYFAVTDYNAAHIESVPDGPVSVLVTGILQLQHNTGTNGGMLLNFPVSPTHYYIVQASTNLFTWTNLWQSPVSSSNAWVQYTDPTTNKFTRRYYRLQMH